MRPGSEPLMPTTSDQGIANSDSEPILCSLPILKILHTDLFMYLCNI